MPWRPGRRTQGHSPEEWLLEIPGKFGKSSLFHGTGTGTGVMYPESVHWSGVTDEVVPVSYPYPVSYRTIRDVNTPMRDVTHVSPMYRK